MKTFIISLALLAGMTKIVLADIENHPPMPTPPPSQSAWIDTNNVLISNAQSPEVARRDCETTMHILSIMSNDRIVFRSKCEPSYNPRCNYYYCYQLGVKVLVVAPKKLEE